MCWLQPAIGVEGWGGGTALGRFGLEEANAFPVGRLGKKYLQISRIRAVFSGAKLVNHGPTANICGLGVSRFFVLPQLLREMSGPLAAKRCMRRDMFWVET